MTDDAPPSGPESSITPDKVRGRLAEDLRGALARGEEIKLSIWARRYGLSVAEVGKILAGVRAMAAAVGERPAEVAARTDAVAAKAPPSGPPPLPADYEILGELGRGAMGVVYRARQRSMDRVVAVKVLRPGDALFANLADRFRREVKALAKLRHPHIVAVHDVGEAGGHLFFSMDLVEGRSLHDLVQAGEVTPTRAVKLMTQVASAIAYTHSHGLVHRDLKPGNILVDGKGEAFVVDFGLARDTAVDGQLTGTGQILGTPAYMAPEQAKGDAAAIGEPSDVYALGAVLYECLTKRPPFEGRSLIDTIRAVVHDEPVAPRKLDPRIPRDLEVICQTAMAKEPQRRYSSAQALQEDLERFVEGLPIRARPASAPERLRRWAARNPAIASSVGGAFVVLVAALAVTSYLLAETTRERNDKAAAVVDRDKALRAERAALAETTKERDEKSAALERGEGLRLAAHSAATRDEDPALALALAVEAAKHHRGGPVEEALRDALEVCHERCTIEPLVQGGAIVVAPDGRSVATSRWRDRRALTQLWRLDDGAAIAALPGETFARFSPGGTHFVTYSERTGCVTIWDTATTANVAEFQASDVQEDPPVDADMSSDGTRVLTASKHGSLRVWRVADGVRIASMRPVAVAGDLRSCRFSPDGERVYASADGGTGGVVHVFEAATGAAVMTLDPANGPSLGEVPNRWARWLDFSLSGDGRLIAAVSDDGQGRVWSAADGAVACDLTAYRGGVARVQLDASGRRALVECRDGTARVLDLADGRELASCTIDVRTGYSPMQHSWSADGERVASAVAGNAVRVWDAATGRELARFADPEDHVWASAMTPDGRSVACGSGDRTVHVWDVASWADQTTIPVGRDGPIHEAFLGPSGNQAITVAEGGLRFWDFSDGAVRQTSHTETQWGDIVSPDGRRGFVARPGPNGARMVDLATGKTLFARSWVSGSLGSECHGFSADGIRLVVTDYDRSDAVLRASVLDAATGRGLAVVPIGDAVRFEVGLAADGRFLFASTGAPDVTVWEVERARQRGKFEVEGTTKPELLGLSSDGSRLVVRTGHGVALWDVDAGREVDPLAQPAAGDVVGASFSPDGRRLLTRARDGTLVVRSAADGRVETACPGPEAVPVAGAAWSPDGRRIAVAGDDANGAVWTPGTTEPLIVLRGHTSGLRSAQFSAAGDRLVTIGADGTSRVFDAADGNQVAVIRGHPDVNPPEAAWIGDGSAFVTKSDDGAVRVWRTEGLAPLLSLTGAASSAWFSPDARVLVAGSELGLAPTLWRLPQGKRVALLTPWDEDARVEFSADGGTLAAVGAERVRIWDAATGRLTCVIEEQLGGDERGGAKRFDHAKLGADGRRLTTWSTGPDGATVEAFWDTATGARVPDERPEWMRGPELDGAELSPDGAWLVVQRFAPGPGSAPSIEIRSRADPKRVISVPGVRFVAYAPDGRLFTRTGDADAPDAPRGTAQLRDPSTGRPLVVLRGGDELSRDGRFVVGLDAGTCRVWDSHTGREVVAVRGARGTRPISAASLSPDGRSILTTQTGTGCRVWPVDLLPTAVARMPRGLRPSERDRFEVGTVKERAAAWRDAPGAVDEPALRSYDDFVDESGGPAAALARLRSGDSADAATRRRIGMIRWTPHAYAMEAMSVASYGYRVKPDWTEADAREALRHGRHALTVVPRSASGLVAIAAAQLRLGDLDAAAEALDGAAAADAVPPAHAWCATDALALRTIVEKRRGREDAARRAFARLRARVAPHWFEHSSGPTFEFVAAAMEAAKPSDVEEDVARTWGDVVTQAAWDGQSHQYYLTWIRYALRTAPDSADVQTAWGVTQYRMGAFADADATLTKANTLHAGREPADVAFLGLAQLQLGRGDDARRTLAGLRPCIASQEPGAQDTFAPWYVREVESMQPALAASDAVLAAARELLATAARRRFLRDEILDAVARTRDAPGDVRAVAQVLGRCINDAPTALNERAWGVVAPAAGDAEACAAALRAAAAAVRGAPDDVNVLNTLGVAQYRTGDFAAAAATLATTDKRNEGKAPSDLAFLAMAQWKLGRADDARATLGLLREAMKAAPHATNAESRGFLREAEALIAE